MRKELDQDEVKVDKKSSSHGIFMLERAVRLYAKRIWRLASPRVDDGCSMKVSNCNGPLKYIFVQLIFMSFMS